MNHLERFDAMVRLVTHHPLLLGDDDELRAEFIRELPVRMQHALRLAVRHKVEQETSTPEFEAKVEARIPGALQKMEEWRQEQLAADPSAEIPEITEADVREIERQHEVGLVETPLWDGLADAARDPNAVVELPPELEICLPPEECERCRAFQAKVATAREWLVGP